MTPGFWETKCVSSPELYAEEEEEEEGWELPQSNAAKVLGGGC